MSWETEKHGGTTDAIILLNKNAKQRREKKTAAAQETLHSTHIIDRKLIPKNLAPLVLAHILDCDSQHFEACPFSSVWAKICSEDGEGKIACGTYMGRFKIVTSTADQWTQYTHG